MSEPYTGEEPVAAHERAARHTQRIRVNVSLVPSRVALAVALAILPVSTVGQTPIGAPAIKAPALPASLRFLRLYRAVADLLRRSQNRTWELRSRIRRLSGSVT